MTDVDFMQNSFTKEFIIQTKELVDNHVYDYKSLSKSLDWNKSAMSLVINGKRNIPLEKWEVFKRVYNDAKLSLQKKDSDMGTRNITEIEFEQDYTHKYIKLLEDHNRELKEKVQANLETVLNNQLAQGSLFESFLRMMTDLLVQGGEYEREQVRVNLHREAIQRLMVLKRKGMKIEIDNDDIVSGS